MGLHCIHKIGLFGLLLLLAGSPDNARAQIAGRGPLAPTERDVAYDDQHPSQILDVYVPQGDQQLPAMIHFHGGGWRAGSKQAVPQWLVNEVRGGRLVVVSVEYRFTDVKPHPAQVDDCLHAIQFVRRHAAKWHIDPKRIGVTGGSAGGHLSLWTALHDDIGDSSASDPVRRESSRVACAVSFAGPTDWSLLKGIEHKHPAYRQLVGYDPSTPFDAMDSSRLRDVSPISFVTADDPPVMQVHGDKDDIVPIEHAQQLAKRLDEQKVVNQLVTIPGGNHGVAGAAPAVSEGPTAWISRYLQLGAPTGQK